jgi:tetratricopeptide (TPR) repeat protein
MKIKKHLWTIAMIVALVGALQLACGGTPLPPTPIPPTPTPVATSTPSADDHIEQGMAYVEQGKRDEAIAEFQKAIELEPDNADAYRNLGTVYVEQGKYEESVAAYEKAIELAPDFGEAYGDLAGVYTYLGRLEEAVAAGKKAIELAPDYATAHNNLGFAYAEKGMLDEAVAEFQEAIRLDPEDPLPHVNLGLVYRNQGKLDEAIAEYEEAIKLDPDDAEKYNSLAIVYYTQGKTDEAIATWKKAIEIDPTNANSHKNLGIAYADEGLVDEAIAAFEKYLELRPDADDRGAIEEKIAELQSTAPELDTVYDNDTGGYSVLVPGEWYHDEEDAWAVFSESQAAVEAAFDGQTGEAITEAPVAMFDMMPLAELLEDLDLGEAADPTDILQEMAEDLGAETGEIETGTVDGYPAALADISGTLDETSYTGALAFVIVEERVIGAFALALPEEWDAFHPTFISMLNSLTFFEPEE